MLMQLTESETRLAHTFCALVRKHLASHMSEIVRRNATLEYSGCCATHDYCDANILMLHAWQKVYGVEPDPACEDQADSWNRAWDTARESGFSL